MLYARSILRHTAIPLEGLSGTLIYSLFNLRSRVRFLEYLCDMNDLSVLMVINRGYLILQYVVLKYTILADCRTRALHTANMSIYKQKWRHEVVGYCRLVACELDCQSLFSKSDLSFLNSSSVISPFCFNSPSLSSSFNGSLVAFG